ncbi:MAG TPA: hypothetical protein PLI09_15905 [Candidatus Hydrogenedentes bacterium]|nr:hypothetical protein [Candidatus Hydrogenedentota bacterium]
MGWLASKKVKYALAGIGALYLVFGAGYLIYFIAFRNSAQGPSELEMYPEREQEIRAQMRVDEMKENLGLSDEQAEQLGKVFASQRPPADGGGPGRDDPREHWRSMRDEINKILTPEQQQRLEESRGQFRGRGGPGPRMTQERIDALKEKMTSDEKEHFEKTIKDWEKRRNRRGPRPGSRSGQDGPPPPGPDGPPPPGPDGPPPPPGE